MEREVAWNLYSEEEKKKVLNLQKSIVNLYQHVRQKENVYALL